MEKKDLNEKFISFLDQTKNEEHKTVTRLNDRVLIVDGLNTFIRAFSVNPSINDDGMHIGGMMGFLRSLRYTSDILKPSRIIVVFDGKGGSTRRRKLYPEYKATRKVKKRLNRNVDWGTAPQDEEQSMIQQMGRLIEYLEQLPITLISVDNVEADDVMAYISQQILVESDIFLMSTDKDFLQLVDDRVKVWSPTKKKLYNKREVEEEYGIPSRNILTYRILDGDKSDNIAGVQGAGLKSIIKYIEPIIEDKDFNVMDLIDYANSSDKKVKLLENIKNNNNLLKRNYLLMQLNKVDIPRHIKLKIQGAINREVPQLIKHRFQVLFLQDKLSNQIKDFDSWIQEFTRIDRFRGIKRV
jgi:DNA polymerase-1|tara:strand:+ start:315 stop:1379 length:1065 start_codon:yes stop_codon:yes gene_type:complete